MPSITPLGTDITVNTVTANIQTTPVTVALADGRFIIIGVGEVLAGPLNNTNYANADIRAQIFNADGSPAGGEFTVNTTTASVQLAPAVVELTDGNIIIAWQDQIGSLSNPASTPAATIRAQEFTSTGVATGSEFQIGADAEAVIPALAPVAGGGFVAAWQQGRSGNVVAQVFDATNTAVGAQIAIDSTNLAVIAQPRLATLNDGNFVIGWLNNPTTAGSQYSLRVYGTDGTPVSAEIPQYTSVTSLTQLGNIIGLESGGFAVASQNSLGGSFGFLSLDLFLPDGTFGTTNQFAQQPLNSSANVRLAPLPNGGLVATWADSNVTGTQPDIRIQAFSPLGDAIGELFTVNTGTTGVQIIPSIRALSTGDLVVTWRDDSSGNGEIRARLIDYSDTNTPPTATDGTLRFNFLDPDFGAPGGQVAFLEAEFAPFVSDPDGDQLQITAITNVRNGTAVIEPGGGGGPLIRVTQTAGAPEAVSFDYTVSDGNGGTATARARVVLPDDYITLRGSNAVVVDFLSNEYLLSRPSGYSFSESSDYLQLLTIAGRPQLSVNPFGNTTAYYDLLIGQTQTIRAVYEVRDPSSNALDYLSQVVITLQGWAQIGGTGRDSFGGSDLPDSLQGGTGAANELVGRGGDDT